MFIGVDGVIVNKTNACGLTPTVSKVSSGALEFVPLYSVKFVSHFFEDAKKAPMNFSVVSTSLDEESDNFDAENNSKGGFGSDDDDFGDQDQIVFGGMEGEELGQVKSNTMQERMSSDSNLKPLIPLDKLTLPKTVKGNNVILVLGSEGEGVSRTIAKSADYRVVIPP